MNGVDLILGCFRSVDSVPLLEHVQVYAHPALPKWPAAVDLRFSTLQVRITVETDDDTLYCENVLGGSPPDGLVDLPSIFWTAFRGQALIDVIVGVNGLAGVDRIQLEFREKINEGKSSLVQILAIASHLRCSEFVTVRQLPEDGIPAYSSGGVGQDDQSRLSKATRRTLGDA